MGIVALLLLGAMCCVIVSDDSEAATIDVKGSSDWSKVSSTTTFTLSGDKAYYFTAALVDGSGTTQSGAVSSSSGTLNSDFTYTLTVTAPKTAGDYTLKVSFYEDSTKASLVGEKSAPLKAVETVKLTANLTSTGGSNVTFNAYFMVNGVKIADSEQSVTVAADGTKSVTYDYLVRDLGSETKFCLQTDDVNAKDIIVGLGDEKSFYTQQSDYTFITVIMVIVLIALAAVLVYIFRKPVKNTGKPKARR